MDLLKTFLSLFFGEEKSKDLTPLLDLLVENNFNIGKALSNADLSQLLPSIMSIFTSLFQNKNDNSFEKTEDAPLTMKVSDLLDDDVVLRLNSAFTFS
jgi:hypothetical protein